MGDPIAYRVMLGSGLNMALGAEFYSVSGVLVYLGIRHGVGADLSETYVYMPSGEQVDGIDFLVRFAPEVMGGDILD